ncbi:DUF2339 domain-containing protein [Sphingomonas silueang]|uniref:DUF2339 domain-containing protein n=1 Tax=Sphingomonas silueang TaxID=3156617 RepID=UPI0032B3A2BF
MTALLFLLVIAMGIALFRVARRVQALEARLADLTAPRFAPAEAPPEPVPEPIPTSPPEAAPMPARLPDRPKLDLEQLVGARLPIWIGGLALVVAGIFLVRLSIEAGWLTPAIRTLLAAAFALALLGASEAARRLPATRDDRRVGQVLAGAGIASAYATLYLAAALYHLVNPPTGFALMLAVTALGLFLALRHGPPTAVMALVGGFAAPLVAGYDAAGIAPLLAYLALFVAALLALASVRGWAWLALTTLAAAFGWSGLLIALLPADTLGGVGAFVLALGVGGTLALPRTSVARPALRLAPLLVALVQMLALAPALDFSRLAWSFYLTLSAAALFLGHRDARLLPGAIAAAALVTLLVAAGLVQGDNATATAWPVALLLFGGAGGAFSRRATGWPVVALTGTIGPLLAAQALAPDQFAAAVWAAIDLALALAGAALARRHLDRQGQGDIGLVGGIAAAALGIALVPGTLLPPPFAALAPLAALAAVAAAHRLDPVALARLALLPAAVALALALPTLEPLGGALAEAMLFEALPYNALPPLGDALRHLLLPALAILAAAEWRGGLFAPARRATLAIAATLAILGGYVLLKQVLAIATLPRFVALGFAERAVLTDLVLLAGWALWRHRPAIARALVALAFARLVWFDLFGLNPLWVEQAVGPLPLLNAATFHLVLFAAVTWRLPGLPRRSLVAALLTLLAVLATLRQWAHGTLLTGSLGTPENWSYSAAMLALAIVWLWRGTRLDARDLRRFGLSLLTLATLKVFLIDAAALGGVWRILSFLGLGLALIAIGWGYRRFVTAGDSAPPADPARG